jgi:hypothetical protein
MMRSKALTGTARPERERAVPGQERRLKTLGLLDDEGGSTYDAFFKDGIA